MDGFDSRHKSPQDLVAIFHASFHPTRGNVIDWSLKASDDIELDNLEFSTLPSGLHLVDQDVIYFSNNGHQGICAFRRVKTAEEGQRGFRLSSLGILVAKSARPKPWLHISALQDLIAMLYSRNELSNPLAPSKADWGPSQRYFEAHRFRGIDTGGAGEGSWKGWSYELDGDDSDRSHSNPTLHLPHLLRILGPSTLTLYKHVVGRKRILIYTLPPVEAACILCQIAADFCYEEQVEPSPECASSSRLGRLVGKNREPISVLGMITLSDLDKLQAETQTGRGWIACTTDAIFLEKPSHYDLLIDLTTSTPNKSTRPTFYSSRATEPTTARGPTHRLSTIRFAWSDVKLWNELDRILQLDPSCSHPGGCCSPLNPSDALKSQYVAAWTDVWRVYEDVCLVCAGLWMGSWRGNSTASYSTANGARNWGTVRLEGDDDLSYDGLSEGGQMRNLGQGIEGRPAPATTSRSMRRSSAMSWSSGQGTVTSMSTKSPSQTVSGSNPSLPPHAPSHHSDERDDSQLRTTLALLQTFHAHTLFQLSILESFLSAPEDRDGNNIVLTPKDVLTFELGPYSTSDEQYLEWLAREYGGGSNIMIKRSWKDLFGIVFGYG
ncbi:hypothetical protein E1B28_013318 [Marasmius oreades]|uniref:Protein LCHN n=1 Tax=Marasmius oreades TaxID=181124 RepID=A0A9P7RPM2_9AGAR|nr:uncharacterized protein E1B28_013318 [Marasmius oreades]KAG7087342.1 hypothetical protein E1B28_013318 [Marasmius oreades]